MADPGTTQTSAFPPLHINYTSSSMLSALDRAPISLSPPLFLPPCLSMGPQMNNFAFGRSTLQPSDDFTWFRKRVFYPSGEADTASSGRLSRSLTLSVPRSIKLNLFIEQGTRKLVSLIAVKHSGLKLPPVGPIRAPPDFADGSCESAAGIFYDDPLQGCSGR